MPKINLLYVITKLELGGAQKQLLSLINHLDKERFCVFLFTAKDGLLVSQALSIKGLTINKSRWLERPINPLKDALALIEIYRYIQKNNIDIVHTHSSKAGILGRLAARLTKVKVIVHTVHGWSFNDCQSKFWQWLFIGLERIAAQFTDRLIVVAHNDKQKGLRYHIGQENKYTLIHYGIDYTEFNATGQSLRKELGIEAKDLVVGMIACFKPQKAPLDFIKLAKLVNRTLPSVRFLLVGDGVLRKKIEKLIYKFNLQAQVILTGWRSDIPNILSTIDIFVLTSLWEGLPVVILEAMASSKPVIATRTGGLEDIVAEGKTGFLISVGDMKKASERLDILLKDESLRRRIGQNAKDFLDSNFCLENVVKNNENLYRDLVATKETSDAH